jgi:hypothetical protein
MAVSRRGFVCGADETPPPPDLDAGLATAVAAQDGELHCLSDSAEGAAGESADGRGPYEQASAYQSAVEDRLGASGRLADFCAEAQFVDYENARAMFEVWNASHWQNTSGLLLWTPHPAWHSTVRQTGDDDFDVNGAYYGARKGCEPLHVQAHPTTWQVMAANHTAGRVTGASITAKLYDLFGRQLSHIEQQGLNIAPSSAAPAFTVSWPASPSPLHLLRLELYDGDGELLSENTYWRWHYAAAQDMQCSNRMAKTRLGLAVRDVEGGVGNGGEGEGVVGSGRGRLTAAVTNRGDTVAAMVRLTLQDSTGARVLPARYEDNYFWLLPGEARELSISWPSGATAEQGLRISAQAYNASPQTCHPETAALNSHTE